MFFDFLMKYTHIHTHTHTHTQVHFSQYHSWRLNHIHARITTPITTTTQSITHIHSHLKTRTYHLATYTLLMHIMYVQQDPNLVKYKHNRNTHTHTLTHTHPHTQTNKEDGLIDIMKVVIMMIRDVLHKRLMCVCMER